LGDLLRQDDGEDDFLLRGGRHHSERERGGQKQGKHFAGFHGISPLLNRLTVDGSAWRSMQRNGKWCSVHLSCDRDLLSTISRRTSGGQSTEPAGPRVWGGGEGRRAAPGGVRTRARRRACLTGRRSSAARSAR